MTPKILVLAVMVLIDSHVVAAGALSVVSTAEIVGYNYASDKPTPTWSGGALFSLDRDLTSNPVINLFGRDGHAM